MNARDAYFSNRALSKSAIDLLLECPALYKAWLDSDGEDQKKTDATIFGSMFHKLALEPESFEREFAVTSLNLATKAGKEWKESLPPGVTIIKEDAYESALLMAQAVRDHPQAKFLFQNYEAEIHRYWTRPDGVKCKIKPDIVSTFHNGLRFAADLKSTESVNPEAVRKSIANYGYHRQAAWYLDGLDATGTPCEAFIFIFVEKAHPYLVTMCQLDEEALAKGREDCERAVETLKICQETGLYPCYTREILTVSLPHWAV